MKHIFTASLLLVTFAMAHAQVPTLKNSHAITVGYGMPNIYKSLLEQDMQNEDAALKSAVTRQGSTFTYETSGAGPFFLKYDYAVSDKVGIGLVLGYFNANVTETYSYQREYYNQQSQTWGKGSFYQAITRRAKSFSVGGRLNYHFGEKSRIDPYIGFGVGYTHGDLSESFATDDPDVSQQADVPIAGPIPLYLAGTLGVRGYVTKSVGVYVEFGFDKWSLLQAGLAFKFR